ncbi:hypothetical protein Vadar_005596 [Vaccinium darrowii]|uniref:Uncharacterized protein n=1 Tax=Vaccinium darrowii TaxID=229202 RepID=A0ACB7XNE9_9ERIC|nr:hypothetical protein Vadar_005596 [Vaccinium darrowii]
MAEAEFLDLEEESGVTGEISNLCLVGKIFIQKSLNIQAVSNILKVSWETRADFSITPWSNNVFLFHFKEVDDRDNILKEGPWSVMNNLLVLQPVKKGVAVSEIEFSSCPFWVQVHGLPVEKMSRTNAEIIGRRIGNLLGIEACSDGLLLHRSFLRVRVEINLSQPLPKGFWLKKKHADGKDLWISYKYERLSDFCYDCGRIGHENKSCKFVKRPEGALSGYGPDLKTGRARTSHVPIEVFRQEDDEAENWSENLLRQRLETHSEESGEREVTTPTERVEPLIPQQDRTNAVGVSAHHPREHVGVLDLPCGSSSLSPGNHSRVSPVLIPSIPTQNIPLLSIQNYSPPLILAHNVDDQSKYLTIRIGPTPQHDSNPNHMPIPSTEPHYFVTEPLESPRTILTKPLDQLPITNSLALNIEELPPSPSPTKEAQPSAMDMALSSVFDNLSLKRKAQHDPEEPIKPKMLRISEACPKTLTDKSQPTPSPTKSPNNCSRKTPLRATKRPKNPRLRGCNGDDSDDLALVEVKIQQSSDLNLIASDGVASLGKLAPLASTKKALVAGLKQPRPQW